jgi:hypothetical protein
VDSFYNSLTSDAQSEFDQLCSSFRLPRTSSSRAKLRQLRKRADFSFSEVELHILFLPELLRSFFATLNRKNKKVIEKAKNAEAKRKRKSNPNSAAEQNRSRKFISDLNPYLKLGYAFCYAKRLDSSGEDLPTNLIRLFVYARSFYTSIYTDINPTQLESFCLRYRKLYLTLFGPDLGDHKYHVFHRTFSLSSVILCVVSFIDLVI